MFMPNMSYVDICDISAGKLNLFVQLNETWTPCALQINSLSLVSLIFMIWFKKYRVGGL